MDPWATHRGLLGARRVDRAGCCRLSSRGDAVQGQIHQLLIDSVGTGGRLLDVGCGSGELLIRFARQGGCDAELVGIDHWGEDWEYSQVQAESNARAEGVPGLRFVRGTASSLPFATSEFARVVSALTFHEVRDVEDKTVSVGEAVRVLQPGGRFAFVDLFDDVRIYGGRGRAEEAVRQAGGVLETSRRVSDLVDLRWPLTLRQGLKYGVILTGTKSAGT
jgi:SAM-dependent methyltransferase